MCTSTAVVFVETETLTQAQKVVQEHHGKHFLQIDGTAYPLPILLEDGATEMRLHELPPPKTPVAPPVKAPTPKAPAAAQKAPAIAPKASTAALMPPTETPKALAVALKASTAAPMAPTEKPKTPAVATKATPAAPPDPDIKGKRKNDDETDSDASNASIGGTVKRKPGRPPKNPKTLTQTDIHIGE
ncbi:uncharacterized protein LOC125764425 [Anopheles funestus]|uniref:uncharacterized protein LOC125764425 n=1 Tax=Anopheles funestus TaxID=62324 RepID=UPI0020C6E908|nr:uncharacterized protein LOC125764425 [Anopheles funestus]